MKLPSLRRLRRAASSLLGRPLILLYHRIAQASFDPWALCVSARHFAQQLEVLEKRKIVLPLAELVAAVGAGRAPRHAVAITFDDGYADNLEHAHPMLESHGMPATFFLTMRNITRRREFWWDELGRILVEAPDLPSELSLALGGERFCRAVPRAPEEREALYRCMWARLRELRDEARERVLDELAAWAGLGREPRDSHRPLTVDEVRRLAAAAGMSIGAHTITHPVLDRLPVPEQEREIRGGKAEIDVLLGAAAATTLSYPYGAHGPETARIAREAGFACACTTRPGTLGRRSDPWRLPRLVIEDWDEATFTRRLALAG